MDFKVDAGRRISDVEVKYEVKSTLDWDMQKNQESNWLLSREVLVKFKSYVSAAGLCSVLSMIFVGAIMADEVTQKKGPDLQGNCVAIMSSLDEEFYSILFAGSKKRNDVEAAATFLKGIKDKCAATAIEKAHIADLKGEAAQLAYKYTKDEDYLSLALSSYEEALRLNTPRSEKVYWHLARLMRVKGDFEKATIYINKVLNMEPEPKDPTPYLGTAFQIAVDTESWGDAKNLIEILSRRDNRFYADPSLLLSAVKTLCHFGQLDDAKISIRNVEEHVQLNTRDKELVGMAHEIVNNCRRG